MFRLTPEVTLPPKPRKGNRWGGNYLWQKDNIKRIEAKTKGEMFYTREQPCRAGHTSSRYVKNDKCVECSRNAKIEYKTGPNKAKHLQTQKRLFLKYQYGLTEQQYCDLYNNQKGLCAICKEPEFVIHARTKKIKKLAIDHCKITKKVRGLLCQRCNQGIGLLRHNSNLLRNAALYCETI